MVNSVALHRFYSAGDYDIGLRVLHYLAAHPQAYARAGSGPFGALDHWTPT